MDNRIDGMRVENVFTHWLDTNHMKDSENDLCLEVNWTG